MHLDGGAGGVPAKPGVEQVEGAGAAGGGGAILGGGQAGGVLGGGQDDVLGVPPQPELGRAQDHDHEDPDDGDELDGGDSPLVAWLGLGGWSSGAVQALGEAFEGAGDGVEEPVDGGQGDDQHGGGHEDVLGHGDAVLAAVEGGELGAAGQPEQQGAQPLGGSG